MGDDVRSDKLEIDFHFNGQRLSLRSPFTLVVSLGTFSAPTAALAIKPQLGTLASVLSGSGMEMV